MPRCTKSHVQRLSICFLTLIGTYSGFSQLRQPYSGPLQLGAYQGNANYTYKVIEGDTVLDGTFQMKRSNLEALLQKSDSSFSISGNFSNDYPSGNWRFQFGEFKSDSTTQVVDFQYKLNVDGVQNEAFGAMSQGRPDGVWQFRTNHIKNSEIEQTLFHSSIEFDQGVPQKSFQIQNSSSTLVGRFLRDGLAHDEWTLYDIDDLDAIESWQFDDGWLKTISFTENGSATSAVLYADTPEQSTVITMDSRYFQILGLKASLNGNAQVLEQHMNALLKQNAEQYEKINAIFTELGEASFYPDFKVRVGHYPLDSLAMQQLAEIRDLHTQSKKITDGYLNNTQLSILKLSDARANYLYGAIAAIAEKYVQPFDALVAYSDNGILPLLSRSELINSLWANGLPNKELQWDDATYTGPNAAQYRFELADMATLLQMATYANGSLQAIALELNEKLIQDKRQQEYLNIEEQLIQKRNALRQFVDSVANSERNAYGPALNNIIVFADERLGTYSNMAEGSDKLDMGRTMVSCFDTLNGLAKAVAIQTERNQEIETTYLDAIWNPFMATIMNEEVKKRITNAYRRVLLPYLVQKTTTELRCENAQALLTAYDAAYERMLQLREEETQKLERKLKREQDPLVVMQLFNLEPLGEN
ncbi:MAG: hypothetical protein ED555_11335 [Allomuricauda sp.]|nr:MAG: hypothetical protein ED555_11335 [Allomuricauda sp.]